MKTYEEGIIEGEKREQARIVKALRVSLDLASTITAGFSQPGTSPREVELIYGSFRKTIEMIIQAIEGAA